VLWQLNMGPLHILRCSRKTGGNHEHCEHCGRQFGSRTGAWLDHDPNCISIPLHNDPISQQLHCTTISFHNDFISRRLHCTTISLRSDLVAQGSSSIMCGRCTTASGSFTSKSLCLCKFLQHCGWMLVASVWISGCGAGAVRCMLPRTLAATSYQPQLRMCCCAAVCTCRACRRLHSYGAVSQSAAQHKRMLCAAQC